MGEAATVEDTTKEEEDINWMEDDGKTEEGEGEGEATDEQGAEEKGEETSEKTDEDKGEAGETKEEGTEEKPSYSPEEEIRELRSLLRNSKRQMSVMDAQLKRTNAKSDKALQASMEEDEETGEKVAPPDDELSNIEKLQAQLSHIGQERGPMLEILAETMEQSPKYSDLREVCSRANFDDVFDVIASEMERDGKGDKEELLLKVETDVWSMTNPYKYMYDFIKANNPKHAPKDKGKAEEKTSNSTKTMTSLAGTTGGSASGKSGWTSARIDALSEGELDKVPADIYEKYITGELD